ncbi:tetratricopeptide repeat protein [Halocynthiibacter sp. C4]|uniref:tetratricopeptide repeat protein n=1 Tax=Halocynthiibacter sp. C4 TaxID=2992758 RepID=UPI00237AE712|nr:tetratricopeptide repeat protein [Halocynthiibacter sp. C4]MDE0590811.1 tetratricopeptide repeat protein [Halocynthiibacter sp. C4]
MSNSLLRSFALSALCLFPSLPASSEGFVGAYLAGQSARFSADFEASALYYTRALALDPTNAHLMNVASAAYVSKGDLASAVPIARSLDQTGTDNLIANIVLASNDIIEGDYAAVTKRLEAGGEVGPIATELLAAWAAIGEGKMSRALELFDEMALEPGLSGIAAFHKALALGSVGDFEGAEAILSNSQGTNLEHTRLSLIAHLQVLSQLERNQDALDILKLFYGDGDVDPEFSAIKEKLEAGETVPFTAARNPREGAAQSFFTLAEIFAQEAAPDHTILYSRAAEFLNPEHLPALLLTAGLLEELEQYELANAAYAKVPEGSVVYHVAEMGRSETLRKAGKPDEAIEVLTALADEYPTLPSVSIALGDLYRSEERYAEAAEAYDAALALFPDDLPGTWFIYYSRGICYERLDEWEKAEADFRKALSFNENQPQVLNYLGYSMVEKNINLDEALEMIETAVAARPRDGYIIDSLAWVYYKLGRFEDAVAPMEKAAVLEPLDPIVSDHLGDVLWMVGRKNEASFQWRRALSLEPEEEEADRIRRKLEVGLDVVLEEEALETDKTQ